ncbi:hypothetical protein PINS_up009191 [Pythium insidiosum]|nr:hypothetical protein PINS_up009191 [Pythium insidiosum]
MSARRREEESSMSGYENEFHRAATELRTAAQHSLVQLSDAQKISLYALFKQGTDGDCRKPQPSAFQPVERAKWNGWKALEGMDPVVAQRRYVLTVMELVPSFKMPTLPAEAATAEPQEPQEMTTPPAETTQVHRRRPRTPASTPATTATSRAVEPAPAVLRQETVPSFSMTMIVLELVALALGVALVVVGSTKVVWPTCHRLAARHLGIESCDGLKAFAPALWFVVGMSIVTLLRSKMFAWRLLSGQFVWLSAASPLRRVRRVRRRRRVARDTPPAPPRAVAEMLKERGIHLVREPEGQHDRWATPRVELVLPRDPEALSFGHATLELPFSLEQTADVYYRKFKEPLPDPASHLLVAIETQEERALDEWNAVYRRRLLRFRNAAPYLIKRFASSDFVEYIEHSLLDRRNRVFYVYIRNESFQSLGTIEDYSIYHAADENPEWTTLTQSARVHITSSSMGFFRSQIESFISNYYGKQAPKARAYHLQRLTEECSAGGEVDDTHASA